MPPVRHDRRSFLSLTAVCAGGVVNLACGTDEKLVPRGDTEHFPQSVASGDPRPGSVVLWTRCVDEARPDEDLELELELALDAAFESRVTLQGQPSLAITALAAADHCVRVRVMELEPATTYYYRFRYQSASGAALSRTGRTRTAPAETSDVPVRFAVVACQDYDDKYFHVYRHLVERDLDFFVHLGDYVYETAQATLTTERRVVFSEPETALGTGDSLAARSLSNYRDLYRTARSDPDLQRAHELYPMIAVYDDHEFSNDCYGATVTSVDGAADAPDLERRANADQAWVEYMPVDHEALDRAGLGAEQFPDNLRIYRDFRFGAHLHLVLGDLRRYRSDHLVPEDAHPGAVFIDQAQLTAQRGTLPADAVPYLDIDTFAGGVYRDALVDGAATLELTPERIGGVMSAAWINSQLELLVENGATVPDPIDLTDPTLERGYAYHQLMKLREQSAVGARYVVRQAPFEALAALRWQESGGSSETAFGAEQEAWFVDRLQGSSATWKVWGSQYAFMPRVLDLTQVTLVPADLRDRFNVTAEDWDGMPNRRRELLHALAGVDNVVIVTGDLHAFFAGTPFAPDDVNRRVVEFVTGSVSSMTWRDGIRAGLTSELGMDPTLQTLGLVLGDLLMQPGANPHMAFQNIAQNGYVTVSVDGAALVAELHQIDSSVVRTPDADLGSAFTSSVFRVLPGAPDLYRDGAEGAERWDVVAGAWRPA